MSTNITFSMTCDDPAAAQEPATRNYVDTPLALNAVGNTGSTETLNFARMIAQSITLDANCTLTFSNATSGGIYLVKIIQDGTGSRTITWPAAVKWAGGAPTLSTAAGAIDIATFFYDGTNYFGNFAAAYV